MSDVKKIKGLLEILKDYPTKSEDRRKSFMAVSGYPCYEDVVSDFLAFMFNDSEEHGWRSLWIDSLLSLRRIDTREVDVSVCRDYCTDKGNRIDLLIESQNYVVCIVNMIYSDLTRDLQDYFDTVYNRYSGKDKAFVFCVLSPEELPEYPLYESFINNTYPELFDAVRSKMGDYIDKFDNTWIKYMKSFIDTVEEMCHESGKNNNENDFEEIKSKCLSRFDEVYKDSIYYEEARNRLDKELKYVENNTFAPIIMDGYILEKETIYRTGIAVAKGPAASSIINYLLRITRVDPVANHLDCMWYFGPERKKILAYEFIDNIDDLKSAMKCSVYREQVYEELTKAGISKEEAYEITEFVRKGKAYYRVNEQKWLKYKNILKEYGVSDCLIEKYEANAYFGTIAFQKDATEALMHYRPNNRIKSSFIDLDYVLGGGFKKGNVYLIAGRTNVGKTKYKDIDK